MLGRRLAPATLISSHCRDPPAVIPDYFVQVVLAITCGSAIPVLSQASSRFAPSSARKVLVRLLARCKNCMYSQLVG